MGGWIVQLVVSLLYGDTNHFYWATELAPMLLRRLMFDTLKYMFFPAGYHLFHNLIPPQLLPGVAYSGRPFCTYWVHMACKSELLP